MSSSSSFTNQFIYIWIVSIVEFARFRNSKSSSIKFSQQHFRAAARNINKMEPHNSCGNYNSVLWPNWFEWIRIGLPFSSHTHITLILAYAKFGCQFFRCNFRMIRIRYGITSTIIGQQLVRAKWNGDTHTHIARVSCDSEVSNNE